MSSVAPHAGAWIETIAVSIAAGMSSVAPHAGAWIETLTKDKGRLTMRSRPSRRGVD
tara:strand:+ start:32693 stop:32863 length:171 start_codon:yes stop_codon:yes gene_type:complete